MEKRKMELYHMVELTAEQFDSSGEIGFAYKLGKPSYRIVIERAPQAERDRDLGEAVRAALGELTKPDDLRLTADSHWMAGFQFASGVLRAIATVLEREQR